MASRRARRAEAAKRAVNQEPPVSGTGKIAVEEEPAPATERDPVPPVEEPAPVSVEQPIEVPDDAIELSTVRLFRADSDGHDGRHWDSARKWCTSAGLLYVATDGGLRVYGPGAWWGVAE